MKKHVHAKSQYVGKIKNKKVTRMPRVFVLFCLFYNNNNNNTELHERKTFNGLF